MQNLYDRKETGWKATSTTGVVAADSAEAVAAGTGILEGGGNAADAAVATILVLNVSRHGACSIGGEVPLLIYEAQRGEVKALSGQGAAPLSQKAIDWYMRHGIPNGGDIKMAPVPSVVDLCITTLQRYGTRRFKDVVAPTLALLDAGTQTWQPKLAHTLRRMVVEEQAASGSRAQRLQAAADRFYGRNIGDKIGRDDIADELEAYYIKMGGFLRRTDLAAHATTIEPPVTIDYRGYTICKCGPWTQGPVLCQALKLLEGFDLKAMGHLSVDYIHVVTEALKLAMADRDAYYGDPDFVEVPLAALLSDRYSEMRRRLIQMGRASIEARPGDPHHMRPLKGGGLSSSETGSSVGGTSTCIVADRWGNVVAATPSANVPEEPRDGGKSGVTFGNRLRSLNTTPGHPNCIEPGKRPRSTLTPTLVLKDGRPIMAMSVAGGDLQDQVALNLLLDVIEFGMCPEEAVTAPRFATAHHQDSFDPNPERGQAFVGAGGLLVSEQIGDAVRQALCRRGHRLEVKDSPIASPVMLYIDRASGRYYAAGDPNGSCYAAGQVSG